MLLACCFREPKPKKQKKKRNEKKNFSFPEKEGEQTGDSARLLDGTLEDGPVYTVYKGHEGPGPYTVPQGSTTRPPSSQAGSTLDLKPYQERHPRLLKQKSQESLRSNRSARSRSIQESNTIPFIDQSPLNEQQAIEGFDKRKKSLPSQESNRKESLPSPPTTPKEAKRPLSQLNPFIVPPVELSQVQKNAQPSFSSDGQTKFKRHSSNSCHSSPTKSWSDSQSSLSKTDSVVAPKGLQRSKAFHDGSTLEDQVKQDEDYRKQEADLIERLTGEKEAALTKQREEHRKLLENAENQFKARLAEDEERNKKKIENAVMNAKNDANATISQLNRQIVIERAKLVTEQQQNSQNLAEEFRLKEERLNTSIRHIEERENEWQQEKAEVLQEVQRLKAEASKMVSILAMELDEEQLSEERKRCLTAEVYSLQLVVEMRSKELKNMREQLAKSTQELEEYKGVKDKLRKAEARLDDLKEQITVKSRVEKQLSEEKCQLERTVCTSSKAVERMSQNVEELQWRIRNNFDLPITHLASREGGQPVSLPDFNTNENLLTKQRPKSTTQLDQSCQRKNSLFTVSKDMLEATMEQEHLEDEGTGATSDFSPSSDTGVTEVSTYPGELVSRAEESQEKDELNSDDDESAEIDSLDEGLGDISSENETVDSPTPEFKQIEALTRINETSYDSAPCQLPSITTSPERRKFLELQLNSEPPNIPTTNPPNVIRNEKTEVKSPSSPSKSPIKERIPSRIAFETPL